MERQRLDKLVADYTRCSRKDAKILISRGLVLLNGAAAPSTDVKVGPIDRVVVEGKALPPLGHGYIMLNKPTGVLCATKDKNCPTVLDLLPPELQRKGLFPAGRLDKDTEGFVLITDDGDFAHKMLAPRSHVPKTYFACLDGPLDEAMLTLAFGAGVNLDGGERTSPAQLTVLENGARSSVELVIYEGMFHQVKRMFLRFGLKVTYLRRDAIGKLRLDTTLALGEARDLLPEELAFVFDRE